MAVSTQPRQVVCVTNTELLQLRQEWSVGSFTSLVKLCKPGQCLRSATFKHRSYEDVSWQLCLYPGGKREENKGYVSLFLKMYAPPAKDVCINAEYRLYFIGDNGEKKFTNVNVGEFYSREGKRGFGWGLRNLPRQKVLSCLRKDSSLYIHCEVDLLPDLNGVSSIVLNSKSDNDLRNEAVPMSHVQEMSKLLDSGLFSDFTITTDVVDFAVHRCVLAAHSEVFRAMFETDMAENKRRLLRLDEFSSQAVRQMLHFIYVGTSPGKLDELAEELLGLADLYGLPDLKTICERELVERVKKDNVCHLVALADLYRSSMLKTACISVINGYKGDVIASKEWSELRKQNPTLLNEVLERLVGCGNDGPSHSAWDDDDSSRDEAQPALKRPRR